PCRGDRLADGGELLERGRTGLVAEKILSVLHRTHTQRRAPVRNRGAQHQLHGRIAQNLVFVPRPSHSRIALAERRHLVRLFAESPYELTAAALHGTDHAVDVVVAHATNGKADGMLRLAVTLRWRGNGLLHDVLRLRAECGRQSRKKTCNTEGLEDRP